MRAAEARALGALAGHVVAGTATRVEEVHQAVLARTPARRFGIARLHDAIAAPVYATVRGVSRVTAAGAGAALGAARPAAATPLADSRAGATALGALAGLCGDVVAREHAALGQATGLRVGGRAVAAEPAALEAAFPEASPRLAVFVHGLCETEAAWGMFAPEAGPSTYGDRLRRDLGHTPLYVRYNTGLPVRDNGRRLADLLDAVVAGWPVPVEEVLVVGHSLGGLVAVRASHDAHARGLGWVRHVRHVVCLVSPHHGAPLAKAAHEAARVLARVPETRAFARVLELRSAAVRDLRLGPVEDAPLVAGATYHAVSATVTRDAAHPLGRAVGDLLVRQDSAAGRGVGGVFAAEHGHHAGAVNHFRVLNDPALYDRLLAWVARDDAA